MRMRTKHVPTHARLSLVAFSLVELSIVLVILGLLVGGVLTGRSLIRASELRTVTRDFQKYQAATQTFRDKYFGIPGDINNATAFWGSLGGTGLTTDTACANAAPSAPLTCNGDGNGFSSNLEYPRYWQQLANAGLIEGSYNGCRLTTCGNAKNNYVAGVNAPAGKIANSIIYIFSVGVFSSTTTTLFGGEYGNALGIGGSAGSPNNVFPLSSYILLPEEAWNIDSKMDDGLPGTGRIIAGKGDGTTTFCTSVAGTLTDTGATYRLDVTNADCSLFFVRAF